MRKTLLAGIAAMSTALVAALYVGTVTVDAPGATWVERDGGGCWDGQYFEVQSVPGYECSPGAPIVRVELFATDALLSMVPSCAAPEYAVAELCAPESDAEVTASPIQRLPDTVLTGRMYEGGPQVRIWLQGHPEAPFDCACSTGTDCGRLVHFSEEDGIGLRYEPLPLRTSVHRSQLVGEGCFPRSCVVFSGRETWPSQCPAPNGGSL